MRQLVVLAIVVLVAAAASLAAATSPVVAQSTPALQHDDDSSKSSLQAVISYSFYYHLTNLQTGAVLPNSYNVYYCPNVMVNGTKVMDVTVQRVWFSQAGGVLLCSFPAGWVPEGYLYAFAKVSFNATGFVPPVTMNTPFRLPVLQYANGGAAILGGLRVTYGGVDAISLILGSYMQTTVYHVLTEVISLDGHVLQQPTSFYQSPVSYPSFSVQPAESPSQALLFESYDFQTSACVVEFDGNKNFNMSCANATGSSTPLIPSNAVLALDGSVYFFNHVPNYNGSYTWCPNSYLN